jgi:periplasmic protein TonB
MKLSPLPRGARLLLVFVATAFATGFSQAARGVTRAPSARVKADPTYPFDLRRAGVEGSVTATFTVDPSGRTRDIVIVNATHEAFAAPAKRAIEKWTYKPAQANGTAIAASLRETIHFRIR